MSGTTAADAGRSVEKLPSHRSEITSLRLRSELHFCRIGARFIFLDIAASRYFLLEGSAAERFASFCDGIADVAALDWLQEQHIVERGVSRPLPLTPSPPTRSVFDSPLARPNCWLIAEALFQQTIAVRRVHREPLAAVLSSSVAGGRDKEACSHIAAACRMAARYRSMTDQCLPNALAMRAMLARRGIAADIVIGVMLPFMAHCWLQSGDMVLSDPFGRVQNFHPLVAI